MHPRCRSTISAVIEGGARTAKVRGKNIRVPADMTYGDYKRVYVDKSLSLKDWQSSRDGGKITPAGFRRQAHFSSSDENISSTNPKYAKSIEYQRNCQRCVPAYEMRMRGYDVTAKPAPAFGEDEFAKWYWDKVFNDAVVEKVLNGAGKAEITAKMLEWGEGARAEVYIKWAGNDSFGHVFIAENRSGEIWFLDPQTGALNVQHYFDMTDNGFTKFFRIDNLEPNKILIAECCEEAAK